MPLYDRSVAQTISRIIKRQEKLLLSHAKIHAIDGDRVDLRLAGSPAILRNVEVIGAIGTTSVGSTVPIRWRNGRPIVMLISDGSGVFSSTGQTGGGSVVADDITIENSSQGIRVKVKGIGLKHLSFTPSLEGHQHVGEDPFTKAGWKIGKDKTIYQGDTFIHPWGGISLGVGDGAIKLSSMDPDYRIWGGVVVPEVDGDGVFLGKFALKSDGSIISTLGFIGGWTIGDTDLSSDNITISSATFPFISLGAASDYLTGTGFWVGKDSVDSVYKMHLGNPAGIHMFWDGTGLTMDTPTVIDGEIRMYADAGRTIPTIHLQSDGDAIFGSDISAVSTTVLNIFAQAQVYDSENMGAGDILIGDHSNANILWDASDGQLKFRGGTTTELYIDVDGTLFAGGGNIRIGNTGIEFPDVSEVYNATESIRWRTVANDTIGEIYAIEVGGAGFHGGRVNIEAFGTGGAQAGVAEVDLKSGAARIIVRQNYGGFVGNNSQLILTTGEDDNDSIFITTTSMYIKTNFMRLWQAAAPGTPLLDTGYLYHDQVDNKLYWKDDAATVYDLTQPTLTTEQVEDIVGAMVSGNTETLIAVTYQDGDGTFDFIVDEANIDHGSIAGLADDDHAQYLRTDGTRVLSANWDAGAFEIRALKFQSDQVTGTAPFTIASTTMVTNLNADMVDGSHASAFSLAGHTHPSTDITDWAEAVQDTAGAMFVGNTETGITVTYQDADGTVDLVLDTEWIEDLVGAMLSGNTETLITVTYQDGDGTIDFVVNEANIDHGSIAGLADDDHSQYLRTDGTRALSADWDAGAFEIRALKFESDQATGPAPFTIASTTVVTNLNADLLDGSHASAFSLTAHDHDADYLKRDSSNTMDGDLDFSGAHNITAVGDLTLLPTGDIILDPTGNNVYVRAVAGGEVQFWLDTDRNGDNVGLGRINFRGHSSTGVNRSYVEMRIHIVKDDNTDEAGEIHFWTMNNGTLNQSFMFGGGTTDEDPSFMKLYTADAAANDKELGRIVFRGKDTIGAQEDYVSLRGYIRNATQASESGYFKLYDRNTLIVKWYSGVSEYGGNHKLSTTSGNLELNPNALLTFSKGLSANWDAGAFEIRSKTFESDQVTGTAPFTIASTTKVTNLNADTVDGSHASAFSLAGHTHPHTSITDWDEAVEDTAGAMVSGNTETGITVTYQDGDGTVDFVLDTEWIEDLIGAMLSGNTETLIAVTYQDGDGTIDFVVDEGSIDHGSIAGLADDDHSQYLRTDGSRALSANWDAGAFEIRALTFESDQATGTAPFTIASTTMVPNLNADTVDGSHAAAFSLTSHAHIKVQQTFFIEGSLTVTAGVGGVYISPDGRTIDSVYIHCKDPGTAATTTVDVHKNGTTIFTTQANRPQLAWDDANSVAKSGAPDITSMVENDVLTFDIDAMGTGAEDLTITVIFVD